MKQTQNKSRRWTRWEVEFLVKNYATRTSDDIAEWVHRSPGAVQAKAFCLGLRKSDDFMAEHTSRGWYKPGHRSHNKGRSQSEWMSEQGREISARTQFQPGTQRPNSPTFRQPGYECVRNEKGVKIIWIKPFDGRRMMPKHRWLWEQAHGAIPKGYNVQFKDGDTLNCVLDNLYLISRREQVRKNYDGQPAERKAETRRKINETRNNNIRRDRIRLRWGMEPFGKLVKKAR